MNCLESLEILQRRLDGAPAAPDAALEQHLAQCPVCRERHAAARGLLEALKAAPRPEPTSARTSRLLAAVLRDRQRRRIRLRRSLYVTAALAASVLIMLGIAYFNRPPQGDGKVEPGPLVEHKKDLPAPPAPEKKKEIEKHGPPASLAALTGKLADKTLDQAAEPLRQGAHDAGESVQAVTRSARRAFDYFAPMFDMPPAPENAAQK